MALPRRHDRLGLHLPSDVAPAPWGDISTDVPFQGGAVAPVWMLAGADQVLRMGLGVVGSGASSVAKPWCLFS
jgi:hypothetical protein